MRVIISRKGFDSSWGGCASPIFPDGSMLSLPIPSARAQTRFEQLNVAGHNVGQLVKTLTGGRLTSDATTHMDPDLDEAARPRLRGWRPAFGQVEGQLTHLKNCGVQAGDLFLFFGWFRGVKHAPDGQLTQKRTGPNRHVIFGWLQIDQVLDVGSRGQAILQRHPWLRDHPHVSGTWSEKNSIYVATERLKLPGLPKLASLPGGGTFGHFVPARCLTKDGQDKRSLWSLPWRFSPDRGEVSLSLHGNPAKWSPDLVDPTRVLLDSAKIGQEFVLSTRNPGLVSDWLREVFGDTHHHRSESVAAA
jgi:hypothetical protein